MVALSSKWTRLLSSPALILALFGVLATVGAFQSWSIARGQTEGMRHNDNYLIFKHSPEHLVEGSNLYIYHSEDHFNRFKYTPTFAVAFQAFAWMPDWLGMWLWNLLGALVLFFALHRLPRLTPLQKTGLALLVLFELVNNFSVAQTNPLVAGMLVLAFGNLERHQGVSATALIAGAAFIKIYALGMAFFLLFYPNKVRNGLLLAAWMLVLWAVPLLVVSPARLWEVYQDWFAAMQLDRAESLGLSIYGWWQAWIGSAPPRTLLLGLGLLVFLSPLAHLSAWKVPLYRQLFLASLLVWVVVFNHKAESPTYFVAMLGIGIWFFSLPFSRRNLFLLLFALLVLSLIFTDLFPRHLRKEWQFHHYCLKAIPSVVIWLKITWDLWRHPALKEPEEVHP